MKLIWFSNGPEAKSGYGGQTRQVGSRLTAAGHEVVYSANDGQKGISRWHGSMVIGSGTDRYSRDTIREDFMRVGAQWGIVLYDAWVFTEAGMPDPFADLNVAGWIPVDHYPCPPTILPWAERHLTIAMSRYGEEQLRAAGVTDLHYVPHAIEPVFKPTPVVPMFGEPYRDILGIPKDAFVVGIIAANSGTRHADRKSFSEMLQAFAHLAAKHDDVYLYLHTLERGSEGIVLPHLLIALGIPADRVRWVDQWAMKKHLIRDEDMAAIYSSLDVLLATSRGEGFGIPVIEAQACGVPVIVSDFTAQPELVGAGWVVPVQRLWDHTHAAFYGLPLIPEIVAALEDAYQKRGTLAESAVAKAAEYRADRIFDQFWRPVLAEMEGRLEPQPAPIPLNRAQRRKADRYRKLAVAR